MTIATPLHPYRRFAMVFSGQGVFGQAVWTNAAFYAPLTLALVVTDRICGALTYFQQHTDIPTLCLDYAALGGRQGFETALLAAGEAHQIDFWLLNFNRLLSPQVLAAYPNRLFNIHSALLPLFKGFGALKGAYNHPMLFGGATLHGVTEGMDEGPPLIQAVLPKHPGETYEAFTQRHLQQTALLTVDALAKLAQGWPQPLEPAGTWGWPFAEYGQTTPSHAFGSLINPALTLSQWYTLDGRLQRLSKDFEILSTGSAC